MLEKIKQIKDLIKGQSPENILRVLSVAYKGKIVFSTSLGQEDQVLTHLIFYNDLPIEIFTLDTGRLFNETYSVLNSTREKYKKSIKVFYPNTEKVEKLVSEKGPLSFYGSVDNRKECCFIRKVEPLQRALKENQIWITGIRSEQSEDRNNLEQIEWDDPNQVVKVHPLINWTSDEVKAFIKKHNIPYNTLHDKGFESIGCAPCTRAIKNGEKSRDGRWWWEDSTKKECGLHISK